MAVSEAPAGGPGPWRHRPSARALGPAAAAVLLAACSASPGPDRTAADQAGAPPARHVGSQACRACHQDAFTAWQGSHHARAIQEAREGTVAGDFGGAALVHRGKTWRFWRDGPRFMVHAEGPDGAMADYQVTHTFGVEPLQQYLVPFPGGRLQALSAAWDTRRRRWFHVDPGPPAPPGDWLHWTRPGQGWNGMCADCHSTGLRKGYDPDAGTYATTQAELGVGCEACHGAGSGHLEWAAAAPGARPQRPNAGFPVASRGLPPAAEVAICAPCHARRTRLSDQAAPGGELLDHALPPLLAPGLFEADGQNLDEDFEWHAFSQSRMAARGVRCRDCHDPHGGRHPAEGNALCTRCHAAARFDAPAHHQHGAARGAAAGPGTRCVDCHMPARLYMVVHLRRDHSFRIPRPDLTPVTGAPNACNASGCHADRSAAWAAAELQRRWPGARRPHFGPAFAAGRRGDPAAAAALAAIAAERGQPAVVRATALDLLAGLGGQDARTALRAGLSDAEPLLRVTAARRLAPASQAEAARLLGPLLRDPVRTVRAEAAARLAAGGAAALGAADRAAHAAALEAYVAGQRYTSDLPSGPFNLANLAAAQGRSDEAARLYRRALAVDPRFAAAQANLAAVLARQGKLAEAEAVLREARAQRPGDAAVALDLGLLLAEAGRPREAEQALRDALRADPALAAAAANLAVLVGEARPAEAARLAGRAAALRPDEARYAFSHAYYLHRAGDDAAAAAALEALLRRDPANEDARGLLAEIAARRGRP